MSPLSAPRVLPDQEYVHCGRWPSLECQCPWLISQHVSSRSAAHSRLDVQRYVNLLPREIHTTHFLWSISMNNDIFIGEASKDKLHISSDHLGCLHHVSGRYLCNAALFLALAMKDMLVWKGYPESRICDIRLVSSVF